MTDQQCKRVFAALSAYLDGELPARNCRELRRHLKGCKPCLAYLQSLKATIQACGKYAPSDVPRPSPRVRAALMKALCQR